MSLEGGRNLPRRRGEQGARGCVDDGTFDCTQAPFQHVDELYHSRTLLLGDGVLGKEAIFNHNNQNSMKEDLVRAAPF